MMPAVTVVIPVYNCEKYVGRAIQSVLQQPCADQAEVLVVNDGSKDRSGEICDRYAAENANVRVLHKENGGVASARNLGIEQARGNYIAFLDSDDWWEPDFLSEDIVAKFAIGGGNADVYEFAYRRVNYYRNMERRIPVCEEVLTYESPALERFDWHHHCAHIFKRTLLQQYEIRYPNIKAYEDIAFATMALFHAKKQERINKMIFSYFELPGSLSHSTSLVENIACRKEMHKGVRAHIQKYGCDYSQERDIALTTAESLPRLCVALRYQKLRAFVEENCNRYLLENPEERLWSSLQRRIEQYNRHPMQFWLKSRIVKGFPLTVKRICYRLPGISGVANRINSKYIQKMTPIRR